MVNTPTPDHVFRNGNAHPNVAPLASNLLHELTYITWAGDTNGMSWDGYNWLQSMAEVYGWCQCAALANNGQYNDISYNRNADSYS
jgi:hypothetical protein